MVLISLATGLGSYPNGKKNTLTPAPSTPPPNALLPLSVQPANEAGVQDTRQFLNKAGTINLVDIHL
jgi:hypothetical protein